MKDNSSEEKEINNKSQSENISGGDMVNIDFDGEIKQYVDNLVQQIYVQAPPPETEIEHLINSLKTNRKLLKKYRNIFEDSAICGETIDDMKFIAIMRNVVTYIKNIELLIPNITFKGGMAEFEEGETDPAMLLNNILTNVNKIKGNYIIKKPYCPHCKNNLNLEKEYKNLILSIVICQMGWFFYKDCNKKTEIKNIKVSMQEQLSCHKCTKMYCIYIADKQSLNQKITQIVKRKNN